MPTYKAVWNWRYAKNENGVYPISICIYLNRVRKYHEFPIPQNVRKDEWSGKEGAWVKINHPYAFEINNAINNKLAILKELNKRYFAAQKTLTFPLIFKELHKNNNSTLFNTYFDEVIKDPPESLDTETMKRYRACLNHLNKFNPAITFNDLSDDLFQRFKKYCETTANLVGSTINGYFNALKKVVYWSRKENHITRQHEESIFEDIHIKIGKPKKDHLEIEEIQQWKNFVFPPKKKSYERDRDIFLFQIYSGFYYSDVKDLYKSDLKKDAEYGYYLHAERYKNDNVSIVPLWKFPDAIKIIEKYKNTAPKSPYLFSRDIIMTDQVFNRRIKDIAKLLEWSRNVTNKLGRTTNAQLYIRFGANRPMVSKMLGHEKEETTNAYFEVNIRDVIEGVKDVHFEKLGI